MKKLILVAANLFIFAVGIAIAVMYTFNYQQERMETTKQSFVSTVRSMEQISSSYLEVQQESVNNWGKYLNDQSLSLEEAIEFLRIVNSNEDVSAHIIDAETYLGYSTQASVKNSEDFGVDYSDMGSTYLGALSGFVDMSSDEAAEFQITSAYVNPIDGKRCVGFVNRVSLSDEESGGRDYYLLKVIPVNELLEQWIFPTGYEDAEIGLITVDGDYVIRSTSMKSENFFEFIRAYNDMTYPEADALAKKVAATDSGVFEYKNARGEEGYWVYVSVAENSSWRVLGYCPVTSLQVAQTQWTLVGYVCATFGLLFLIDGAYVIYVNRKLRDSVRETESANQAKTQFLSTMSHDIRTPMNAVVGMTAVAKHHIDDKAHVQDCLDKIELASNHLLMLINDILDISKIESDQFALSPTVFSMERLMTNLANIVRPQIGAKHLDFKIHVMSFMQEYVCADELRVNQIFINILSNAVKYTPDGGSITLTLEEQPGERDPKNVRIIYTVEDTGIGMSKDVLMDLFKPFVRADDSRISKIEGSGLGLAITNKMVKAMGGEIEVSSVLGEGSTFCVKLEFPAAENTENKMLPMMDILVVDDDTIVLESTADELKSLGIRADTAKRGEAAIEMVEKKRAENGEYSVIIVDWKMPGMDGVDTIRKIRSVVGSKTSIVIFSAFDYTEIEAEAIAAGANGFLSKPVFRSALYSKITELLNLAQEEKAVSKDNVTYEGMRLLVAEDNNLNWDIINQILKFYNVEADCAENGEICVNMMEEAPDGKYDAIFMDVHMPVMGGKEASRKIRASERSYVRDIPIIAMTADAFAEDIKECIDAGMNAHMAKPIDIKQLEEKLHIIKNGGYSV